MTSERRCGNSVALRHPANINPSVNRYADVFSHSAESAEPHVDAYAKLDEFIGDRTRSTISEAHLIALVAATISHEAGHNSYTALAIKLARTGGEGLPCTIAQACGVRRKLDSLTHSATGLLRGLLPTQFIRGRVDDREGSSSARRPQRHRPRSRGPSRPSPREALRPHPRPHPHHLRRRLHPKSRSPSSGATTLWPCRGHGFTSRWGRDFKRSRSCGTSGSGLGSAKSEASQASGRPTTRGDLEAQSCPTTSFGICPAQRLWCRAETGHS